MPCFFNFLLKHCDNQKSQKAADSGNRTNVLFDNHDTVSAEEVNMAIYHW